MRWGNVRQVIHDAFAIHMTRPNPDEAGGTRRDNTASVCHRAEAGKVMAAVCKQPSYLVAAAILFNAPAGIIQETEIVDLKTRLWRDMMRRVEPDPDTQGAVAATIDHVMLNYKRRCQSPENGDVYGRKFMDSLVRGEDRRKAVRRCHHVLLDILGEYDNRSLQPVIKVISEERGERADEKAA